jgi:hypothetical protein
MNWIYTESSLFWTIYINENASVAVQWLSVWDLQHLRMARFGRNTLTHSPTHSWSWAHLEKLPTVQPLKNFPAFYGTRRFITAFTRALHWSLSWARSIQFIPSHRISLRSTCSAMLYMLINNCCVDGRICICWSEWVVIGYRKWFCTASSTGNCAQPNAKSYTLHVSTHLPFLWGGDPRGHHVIWGFPPLNCKTNWSSRYLVQMLCHLKSSPSRTF